MQQELSEVVVAVRDHPGLRNKASVALVAEVLGPSDWRAGPGDDGAVIADGEATLVVGGEAIWPPFVARDPYGAGVAAVLANVNDLAAMGAVPLAIVDTIVGPEVAAREALAGMRYASGLYQVPVVGGHTTVTDGPPSLSAFGLGRAAGPDQVLSLRRAAAGQPLVVACCTEGTMRSDFGFFASFQARAGLLAGDVRALAGLAAAGTAVAARDVSMPGFLGSLAMLLEGSRLGAAVDLEALPRPDGVDLTAWLTCFPCFGFWLCAPPGREDDCLAPFLDRGLAAARVGTLDSTGRLQVRLGSETATVFDLTSESVTGLPGY